MASSRSVGNAAPEATVRSEGLARRVLKGVALSSAIVGGIILVICRTGSTGDPDDGRGLHRLRFKCAQPQCGREFEIETRRYSAWAAAAKPPRDMLGRADCPACGGPSPDRS